MAIFFHSDDLDIQLKNKRRLKAWIEEIICSYNRKLGHINFIFVSISQIEILNKEHLKHSYPTDILSFDFSQNIILSGDMYISPEMVLINSNDLGLPYNDEMKRVLIHGILHIIGFKDKKNEEIKKMRKAEEAALSIVKDLLII